MRRFRELTDRNEVYQAAIQVFEFWDYPRKLDDTDLDPGAVWYRLGDDCIFWVQPLVNGMLCFHVASSKEALKPHPADSKRLLHALEFIADMHDCDRIVASDCKGDGEVASYLRRWGFTVSEDLGPEVWFERRLTDGKRTESESGQVRLGGRGEEKTAGAGTQPEEQPE